MKRKLQQRRSRTEIIFLMLKATSTGITKTSLMHRLGLKHRDVTNYLNELVDIGLIEIEMSNPRVTVCKITTEGEETLRLLEEIEKRIKL